MKFLNVVFALVLVFGSYAVAQNPNNRQKEWRVSEAYVSRSDKVMRYNDWI
ncbi:hypothetical protein BH20ACI1_BH20ACI1_02240 [soil metagenome]